MRERRGFLTCATTEKISVSWLRLRQISDLTTVYFSCCDMWGNEAIVRDKAIINIPCHNNSISKIQHIEQSASSRHQRRGGGMEGCHDG